MLYSKDQKLSARVIVKNRFLKESLEVFGNIARVLFEVFDEVRLVNHAVSLFRILHSNEDGHAQCYMDLLSELVAPQKSLHHL